MAQNNWGRMGPQRTETEILQQEIHELPWQYDFARKPGGPLR